MASVLFSLAILQVLTALTVSQAHQRCLEIHPPLNSNVFTAPNNDYYVVHCNLGFTILGKSIVHCVDGIWDSLPPTCIESSKAVCEKLPNLEKGTIECDEGPFYQGKACRFRCLHGYKLFGVNLRRCMFNLKWSGREPKCIPDESTPCPAPPPLLNGKVISCSPKNPPTAGKTCSFQCNHGYVLDGPSTVVCRSNGKFTDFSGEGVFFPECKASRVRSRPMYTIHPCQTANGGCHHTCNVVEGQVLCSCREGYILDNDGKYCNDIDECRWEQTNNCQHHCINTEGGYSCSCQPGYIKINGYKCEDINECSSKRTNKCEHRCINTEGGYKCQCEPGHIKIGDHKCEAADPNRVRPTPQSCQTDNGSCHHTCKIVRNRVQCSCREGYRLDSSGKYCNDINECRSEHTNKCQHYCTNTDGGYTCFCQPGYIKTDDYKCEGCRKNTYRLYDEGRCTDCPANSFTDSEGKTSILDCLCKPGFSGDPGKDVPCQDIDECTIDNFGCSDKCVNTPGSAFCSCAPGYMLDTDNKTCIDIDECIIKNGGCQGICHNTDGSFRCSCPEGYITSNRDHYSCDDVDECLENNGGCEQKCTNYLGGYYCSCESGFRLNSGLKNCTDVRCMKLPTPHFSTMKCKKDAKIPLDLESYPVGTICNVICGRGFKNTESSNKVECLADGTWDRPLPECKPGQCPKLSVPENGEVHPPSCAKEGNSIKQICTFTCLQGFQLSNKSVFKCKNNLNWTVDEIPVCNPVSVKIQPTIKCPQDINVDLLPGKASHTVTVPEPITNMKNFKVRPNWVSVGSPLEFPAGTTDVTFATKNPDYNRIVRCTTYINVIDNEPPVFLFCPERIEVEGVGADGVPVTWETPIAIDNVGVESLESTLELNSTFTPGTYIVEYIAKDAAGNIAECSFDINVTRTHCSDLSDPAHGEANCMDWMFGKICKPLCDTGYIPHPNDTIFYSCGDSGAWEPSDSIPDCLKYIPAVSSTCQKGYELITNSETDEEICMECPLHTVWSASTEKCE